jgi:hypothetical protein
MAEQEAWKQLYDYWLSKHAGGRPPCRHDLDPPVDVPRLIPNIMLIDIEGETLRYRLVGSAIWGRYGFDLTGTTIGGRNPAEAEWRDTLRTVCEDQVARLITSPVDGSNGGRLHVAVAMPLCGDGGLTSQILAGTFFAQEFGPNPRIGRITVRELLNREG